MGRGRNFENKCRTPTVQNCLSCTRPDCEVASCTPLHESEIMAEIAAGMLPLKALYQHRLRERQKNGGKPND